MAMSLSILLCVVIIHGTCGTYFPPVNNPPPIPSLTVRNQLSNPHQKFNEPEKLPPNIPQPREERFLPSDAKIDEERWYYEEKPSEDKVDSLSDIDKYDRYYQSGEPAISPVATPIPDETFLSQSSSKLNPTDARSVGDSDIFILSEDTDRQYSPERWVQVQIPSKRLLGILNQDYGVPVATDTVKSVVAPVLYDNPSKSQLSSNTAVNIVQVRQPSLVELQKGYPNYPKVFENVPSVKEIVGIPPPTNVNKQIVQNVSPVAIPPPTLEQISPKNAFIVPPPPPPPLKGVNPPSKVISSVPLNIFPDPNGIISSKNTIPESNIVPGKNIVQQVRHVWIPTSSNTGKFITIPIAGSVNSEKLNVKRFSVDSVPITVSDTWVLNQDGPVPIFKQQKSALPLVNSPIVQSGKVIFQNPTIVQVDGPPNPVVKVDSLKYQPTTYKNVASNVPIDIWPARNEFASSKISGSYSSVIASDVPSASIKSKEVIIEKSNSKLIPTPQKSILTNTKSAFPPSTLSPTLEVVNGKPCPLQLPAIQKSVTPPLSSGIITVPRVASRQRSFPFARIIRVNRYPTGSYYLINKNIRPSYTTYPNRIIIQQPNAGVISAVQTKQFSEQFQRKLPTPLVQTQQIIPGQKIQNISPLPAKQITYPFVSRQVILPAVPPKTSRLIYPPVQAIRYAYPWNAYSNPIFGKGGYAPQYSSFKLASRGSGSESSSSESSSENSSEDSSESSEEENKQTKSKKEKLKKEKPKKEEKEKSGENSNSSESEKEIESENNSRSKEKESEEKSSEKESKESLESSESQISLDLTQYEINSTP